MPFEVQGNFSAGGASDVGGSQGVSSPNGSGDVGSGSDAFSAQNGNSCPNCGNDNQLGQGLNKEDQDQLKQLMEEFKKEKEGGEKKGDEKGAAGKGGGGSSSKAEGGEDDELMKEFMEWLKKKNPELANKLGSSMGSAGGKAAVK
jgi:hypothetical protein